MRISVHPKIAGATIDKNVYGHFAEHLGNCIYGGLFVGADSPIPNVRGIRSDVLEALRKIRVPVLRWPGGCFADEYHWRDGVGPQADRKRMVNTHWGSVVEDNSFGTHEFMDLCGLLGCEPYVNGNLGSGTVEEMQAWVEYMTSGDVSPMADLRRRYGQDAPWTLRYFGVGNENWGCGGNMRPEYYADEYRRYQTYVRNYSGNAIVKIACGPGTSLWDPGYAWTQVMMERGGRYMDALTLHYYTLVGDTWPDKRSATQFDQDEYYATLAHAQAIDGILQGHEAIMDRYDPEARVGLYVDEWGTWFDVEPGTNPGFLRQQNTMRDAMVAAISLNLFNKHARRVRMANIAQTVNVLQAMILTDGANMLCTPTYHVFDLFQVHQQGTLVHTCVEPQNVPTPAGSLARVSESASLDAQGKLHLTVANTHATQAAEIELRIDAPGFSPVDARILTQAIDAHNTFEQPECVTTQSFDAYTCTQDAAGAEVRFTLPACAILRMTFQAE